MKSVMLTIRLKWFYLTYKGIKTIEVRKSCPKDFVGDVYEVVSKTNFEKDLMEIPETERKFFKQFKGKVGLKFTLNKVEEIKPKVKLGLLNTYNTYETETLVIDPLLEKSCLSFEELDLYLNWKNGYAWYISNLVIFDKTKELSEFYAYCKDEKCEYRNNHCSICHREPLTKAPQSFMFIESEK